MMPMTWAPVESPDGSQNGRIYGTARAQLLMETIKQPFIYDQK